MFFITIAAFGAGIIVNYASVHLPRMLRQKKPANIAIASNPADFQVNPSPETSQQDSQLEIISRLIPFYNKIKEAIPQINNSTIINAPFRIRFIEFAQKVNKYLGQTMFFKQNNLVSLSDGYFCYVIEQKASYREDADRIASFSNYLTSRNIKSAYILCPSKATALMNVFPGEIKDYSNENADSLIKRLGEHHTPYLDLRRNLFRDFPKPEEAFFKSDHHWKPETGFWATQKLVEFINRDLKLSINDSLLTEDNFNKQVYADYSLGSQGRKATLALAKPEDISIITPKFPTDFTYEIPFRELKRKGSYNESLLDYTQLSKDYYNKDSFDAYICHDTPVVRIINKNTSSGIRILIVKDSFAKVVVPFLACLVKEIIMVDVRGRQKYHFNGSIKQLIEETQPNLVLLMYNVRMFDPSFQQDRLRISTFD